jgi:hypothetical protein
LEKATIELVTINQKIVELTEEFEEKYLDRNENQRKINTFA